MTKRIETRLSRIEGVIENIKDDKFFLAVFDPDTRELINPIPPGVDVVLYIPDNHREYPKMPGNDRK